MKKDKYPQYGLVAVAAIGVAIWAGIPVSLLLFLLVCPLVMFFMMRGMHGGQENHTGHNGRQQDSGTSPPEAPKAAVSGQPKSVDGSHERLDHP